MDDVFDLVAVRPPYFALDDISISPCSITAQVRPSHPMRREQGPIAAAEAGRHLAIAGAVAAATKNNAIGKHFYLARQAVIQKAANPGVVLKKADLLQITATSPGVSKRRASATATISQTEEGKAQELYTPSVDYDVLSQGLFKRLVGHAPQCGLNSLSHVDVLAMDLPISNGQDGQLGARILVQPHHCIGHFQEFPALPVAKLMHLLSNLAAENLAAVLDRPAVHMNVERAVVSAERLAPAGDLVDLSSRYLGLEADGTHKFACEARLDAGICGTMELFLSEKAPVTAA